MMNVRNTAQDYGLISRLMHWLIALSIIALISMGWYMARLSDEDVLYWRLLDLHELIGLQLLLLVPLKFVWLYFSPNPSYSSGLASWERHIARVVHILFLMMMAVIPFSGFLFVASNGEPIELYGVITIPDIAQFSRSVRDTLSDIHYYLSYTCAGLIMLHVSAALKHHFMDVHSSLRRMTF